MKKLFSRLAEFAFLFFLSAWLLKTAACWLYSVWPVLATAGGVILTAVIIFRILKHRGGGEW